MRWAVAFVVMLGAVTFGQVDIAPNYHGFVGLPGNPVTVQQGEVCTWEPTVEQVETTIPDPDCPWWLRLFGRCDQVTTTETIIHDREYLRWDKADFGDKSRSGYTLYYRTTEAWQPACDLLCIPKFFGKDCPDRVRVDTCFSHPGVEAQYGLRSWVNSPDGRIFSGMAVAVEPVDGSTTFCGAP